MSRDGLTLGYRIGYVFRRIALALFGPAQLGTDDPVARLRQEREQKIALAQARRDSRS
jgi:hypothetical protein